MSKIGKLPIKLPNKTELQLIGREVVVKGELGELKWALPAGIEVNQTNGVVTITPSVPLSSFNKPIFGLVRAKIANMVQGVSQGFTKVMEISGVGFRAEVHDNIIQLFVGFSHPVKLAIIPGTNIKVSKNEISVSGIDNEAVGEMAARIRSTKLPEPYKGKGIKYQNEIIRRKQGKAVKTTTS